MDRVYSVNLHNSKLSNSLVLFTNIKQPPAQAIQEVVLCCVVLVNSKDND